MSRLFLGFLLCLIFSTSETHAAVWENTAEWNTETEQRYSQWARDTWNEKIFAQSGTPYYGLKSDCADTVYAMRIIFAAENGLPFAISDPTARGRVITNLMARYDELPTPALRLRAFLKFIFTSTGTYTLPADSYPTAVNREAVIPGGFILADRISHHSWTIKEILRTGIFHLIFSSTSRKQDPRLTLYARIGQPSERFLFHGVLDPSTHAGLRAFRRPEDLGKPVWRVPGYSEEQYRLPLARWNEFVQQRLAARAETADEKLTRLLRETCQGALERIEQVESALLALAELPEQACFSESDYDDLSTPGRDSRLKDAFIELSQSYRKIITRKLPLSEEMKSRVLRILENQEDRGRVMETYCPVVASPELRYPIGEIMARSLKGTLSPDPHDSREYRWGEYRGRGPRARLCNRRRPGSL